MVAAHVQWEMAVCEDQPTVLEAGIVGHPRSDGAVAAEEQEHVALDGCGKGGSSTKVRARPIVAWTAVAVLSVLVVASSLLAFRSVGRGAAEAHDFASPAHSGPWLAEDVEAGATSLSLELAGSPAKVAGRSILLNPTGESEELVPVAEGATSSIAGGVQLAAPLQHGHQRGEPVHVLRLAVPTAPMPTTPTPPAACSAAAEEVRPPPVEVAGARSAAYVFDELSPKEMVEVARVFCGGIGAALGPDTVKDAMQSFLSGVAAIELLHPGKAEALAFLDGDGPLPKRYARVTVARPRHNDVMEYKVGPITGSRSAPVVGTERAQLLAPGEVPYSKRPPDLKDNQVNPLIDAALQQLRPLLEKTFGHTFTNFDSYDPKEGQLMSYPLPGFLSTRTSRLSILKFLWNFKPDEVNSAAWLHPVPFSATVNQTGADPKNWLLQDIYYCAKGPYATAAALMAEYEAGRLQLCPWKKPDPWKNNNPGNWDTAGLPSGMPNPRTTKRPPRLVYPDGPRWSVAAVPGGLGRQVSWMGWTFFVAVHPPTGMGLWDLRFKGRRVAYELRLMESAALYAGAQGDQVYYLDSAMTGLGMLTPTLRPGVDCPEGASVISNARSMNQNRSGTGMFDGSWDQVHPVASGCIFEMDAGEAQWSHADLVNNSTKGIRGSRLVVRTMANSGNYDYLATASLGVDGSIEWKSTLAGFAETRWFDPRFNDWERELSPIAHGIGLPVHSHLLNVKVDLDVGGHTANSLEKTESLMGRPEKCAAAGVLDVFPTKYYKSSYVEREGPGVSTMVTNGAKPGVWRIVNPDETGPTPYSPPGYAILPGESTVNVLPEGHPLVEPVAYGKYSMAFTRRHDSEMRSTSPYDSYAPGDAYRSLDTFLRDRESLNRTDIVAWLTVSHEHVPRSEDLPLITNYPIGFKILPWNIYAGNAASDLPDDAPIHCLAEAL